MRTHKVGGTRLVDGRYEIYEEQVQFTAQEELVRDAEETQAAIDKVAEIAKNEKTATDRAAGLLALKAAGVTDDQLAALFEHQS